MFRLVSTVLFIDSSKYNSAYRIVSTVVFIDSSKYSSSYKLVSTVVFKEAGRAVTNSPVLIRVSSIEALSLFALTHSSEARIIFMPRINSVIEKFNHQYIIKVMFLV